MLEGASREGAVLGSVEGEATSGDVVFKAGTGAAVFGADDGVCVGPLDSAPGSSSLDVVSEGSGDGELEGSSLEGALLGDVEGKSDSDVIVSGGSDEFCVDPSNTVVVLFSEAL